MLELETLNPNIGAEVLGVDLGQPIDDDVIEAMKAALGAHSVLVLRGQQLDDETQVAFSARFGALERTVYKREGDGGVPIAHISNVDLGTNEIFPPGHTRVLSISGNEMWHSDSSFKPVPAYCSMLSGREVPPEGGQTEFASCRAGYAALPEHERRALEGLVAQHDYAYSRSLVAGYTPPAQTLAEVPPVRHAVVRTNPRNGRKNFYTGSHASHVVGWPVEEGRGLLRRLVEQATRREFVYAHEWQRDDFVLWDNRCVLHRGRPFDVIRHRRVMRRTTVAGIGPTVDAEGAARPDA